MEKKKYYVSVQSGKIMENQGDAAYELEIVATEDEIDRLDELFEELENFDQATAVQTASALTIAYHHDETNDGYDYYLRQTYSLINELGTEETKRHIQKMNILS
ncbi:hypothetical protein [Paenibacillus hexagrammi]|uniref:Hydrolase n=1 Tax=Paenibacillus hexagrammi TaxID=2908839 RepID=A0ABY3SKZ5_9BACL|nr:hypothetical protein [Paenibacillus sp. YPD9-1]UJF33861.1 hypothetical protein L0M14_00925 [Paenibacillus sp. YPD9-1]